MWRIYALLSALFAALTAVFAKVEIKGVIPTWQIVIRTSVILVLAWAIAIFRGGIAITGSLTKQYLLFLLLPGIATGLSWIFYFKALQMDKVSQVAPVDKLNVAIAIALSVLFLGEQLTLKTAVGAGLIVAGTVVLIL